MCCLRECIFFGRRFLIIVDRDGVFELVSGGLRLYSFVVIFDINDIFFLVFLV